MVLCSYANHFDHSSYRFFFFLIIRRPPRSTLFPTRRSSDLCGRAPVLPSRWSGSTRASDVWPGRRMRSEEHTSELQSRSDLVCRLLLEKKKERSTAAQAVATARASQAWRETRSRHGRDETHM